MHWFHDSLYPFLLRKCLKMEAHQLQGQWDLKTARELQAGPIGEEGTNEPTRTKTKIQFSKAYGYRESGDILFGQLSPGRPAVRTVRA